MHLQAYFEDETQKKVDLVYPIILRMKLKKSL